MNNENKRFSDALVTVITVVYNGIDIIENTINSVINQTYEQIEYIIIDGDSTDGTVELIRKYNDKIDNWISEPDDGIYDAMNKGIKRSSGDWLIFMNAGDRFNSNLTLELVIHNDLNDASVIYGDVYYEKLSEKKLKRAFGIDQIDKGMIACHQSIFFNKKNIKNFIYDTNYLIAADYKLLYSIYKDDKVMRKLDLPIAIVDAEGISNQKTSIVYKEYFKIIKEFGGVNPKVITYYFKKQIYSLFRDFIYQKLPESLKEFIFGLRIKKYR